MATVSASSDAAQLARELLRAGDELADLADTNARAGELIRDRANVPRRSGALAASLRADASAGGVVVASALRYATFVHWGAPRRHIRARPFLLDSLNTSSDELVDLYADHASEVVARIG